ncbi:MAG: hypothetical protein J6W96_04175 [Alphaproteobacteria bacterium]|nr:hypothetical protein [Alphaproteobacteria bacterium]
MNQNELTNEVPEENQVFVAAMDLGTNSNRLLIADETGKSVYRDVRHVALGDGLAENGYFSDVSMERAICSFMDFGEMLAVYGVQKYRAIATAACRMSSNTEAFKAEVKKASGIDLEVISEFEEARLTLLGAQLNAPKDKKYLFVYDLGGGSTEITLATNSETPEIIATVSVPLGARNATEIFNLSDYQTKGAQELEITIKKYVKGFLEKIKAVDYAGQAALIATSSTPLRLAAWIAKHPTYDKFAADGVEVSIDSLDKLIARVLHMNREKRAESPYIGRNRAGIFVAALIIFRAIYQELGCSSLIASLKGAQEAIVAELVSA